MSDATDLIAATAVLVGMGWAVVLIWRGRAHDDDQSVRSRLRLIAAILVGLMFLEKVFLHEHLPGFVSVTIVVTLLISALVFVHFGTRHD